jgi:hypothetical protein
LIPGYLPLGAVWLIVLLNLFSRRKTLSSGVPSRLPSTWTNRSTSESIDSMPTELSIFISTCSADLYEKRSRANVLATDFLPELEAGNIGVIGAAIYIEDRYLPEVGLRVGLDQSRGCMPRRRT